MMRKVLIVEDEIVLRNNMEEIISLHGFEVKSAENGEAGLLLARHFQPDLILCDIKMPRYDGFWLIEQIRNEVGLQSVPFIFVSAKVDRRDVREGMELGADDYITKPFTSNELIQAINSRLDRVKILRSQAEGKESNALEEIDQKEFEKVLEMINRLTPSEKRILKRIAENHSSLEIAKELYISTKTVENHRSNITNKLGLKGHLSLLRFCLNNQKIILS
jgi:two-component system OmpR family response regulator